MREGMTEVQTALEDLALAAAEVELRFRSLGLAWAAGLHREYRVALRQERKTLRIIARRWRRKEVQQNRRPALIHKGGKS